LPDAVLATSAPGEVLGLDRESLVGELCFATREVFSTMLGLEVTPGNAFVQRNVIGSAEGVMSLIGLAGAWTGAGSVICTPACACEMAHCLLMTEYPAVDNEVLDAVAEVTNMVIGNFKTLIEPRTGPLGLSIPSVVYGRNFTIRNGVNDEWTVVPFLCGEQEFEVRVCLMRSRGANRALMSAAV
jgi:chemotaxis protein CheX